MQSRPIFIKFSRIAYVFLIFTSFSSILYHSVLTYLCVHCSHRTLLGRLWASNSLDLILDFSLTFVSVLFNYAGPFFLKCVYVLLYFPSLVSANYYSSLILLTQYILQFTIANTPAIDVSSMLSTKRTL